MPAPHRLSNLYAAGDAYRAALRDELRETLASVGGSVPKAAEALGVHSKTLHHWLTKWGMRDLLTEDP